jgi:DNA-binding MarR family transcriptional regulator
MTDDEQPVRPQANGTKPGACAQRANDADRSRLMDEVNRELGAFREAADRLDEAVARLFGLNRTDLRCIGIIYRHGRLTAGELAEESGLSPGAITTALDRIERAGYANRVADPDDRRRVLVISTQATRELGARLYGEVEVLGNDLLRDHSAADLGIIRDYLRGTREVYERQAASQRAGWSSRRARPKSTSAVTPH